MPPLPRWESHPASHLVLRGSSSPGATASPAEAGLKGRERHGEVWWEGKRPPECEATDGSSTANLPALGKPSGSAAVLGERGAAGLFELLTQIVSPCRCEGRALEACPAGARMGEGAMQGAKHPTPEASWSSHETCSMLFHGVAGSRQVGERRE